LSAIFLPLDTGGDVDRLAFSQGHDGLFDVGAGVGLALPPLGLAFCTMVLTPFTLTSNSASTAALICGLVAEPATLKQRRCFQKAGLLITDCP